MARPIPLKRQVSETSVASSSVSSTYDKPLLSADLHNEDSYLMPAPSRPFNQFKTKKEDHQTYGRKVIKNYRGPIRNSIERSNAAAADRRSSGSGSNRLPQMSGSRSSPPQTRMKMSTSNLTAAKRAARSFPEAATREFRQRDVVKRSPPVWPWGKKFIDATMTSPTPSTVRESIPSSPSAVRASTSENDHIRFNEPPPGVTEEAIMSATYGVPLSFSGRGARSSSHTTGSSLISTWYGHGRYNKVHCQLELGNGRPVMAFMRKSDVVQDTRHLIPGTIISAPHHKQYSSERIDNTDDHVSLTSYGGVYSKYRKMVIVRVFAEHCYCLPIYSFQNKGLHGHRLHYKNEFISIRDQDDRNPGPAETPDEPLQAQRFDEWTTDKCFIDGRSLVMLTETVSHRKFDKCSLEGRIAPRDLKRLQDVHLKAMGW